MILLLKQNHDVPNLIDAHEENGKKLTTNEKQEVNAENENSKKEHFKHEMPDLHRIYLEYVKKGKMKEFFKVENLQLEKFAVENNLIRDSHVKKNLAFTEFNFEKTLNYLSTGMIKKFL